MKKVLLSICCFIFLSALIAAETTSPQDLKNFLDRYYTSKEKGEGASKVVYALLKDERSIAIRLIEAGESLNTTTNASNKNIPTPLMLAINSEDEELVELMIKNKADVNFIWHFTIYANKVLRPISPIELAVLNNQRSNITLMLARNGALIQRINFDSQDALRLSISQGYPDKFFTMVNNATSPFDLKALYGNGVSLLMTRAPFPESQEQKNAILKVYKYLIEANVPMETAAGSTLSTAIYEGNMPLLELLISLGLNIDYAPTPGSSIIFCAIGYSKNYKSIKANHLEYVAKPTEALTLLLELGIKQNVFLPQSKDENSGFSPLGYAVHIHANEAAQKLIEYSAEINKKDSFGQTPLIRAIATRNAEGVKLLLHSGASTLIQSKNNLIPIEFALWCGYREIYDLLLEAEATKY